MSPKTAWIKFLYTTCRYSRRHGHGDRGFTLLEMIVIAVIVGILAAIALPGWLGFLNTRKLNSAQDRAFQAFIDARRQADRTKTTWAASFRINPTTQAVEWAVHPVTADMVWTSGIRWSSFNEPALQIITAGTNGITNLPTPAPNQWTIMFNDRGCPVAGPGQACTQTALGVPTRITFGLRNGGRPRRCVEVTTLLGGLQTRRDQACNT